MGVVWRMGLRPYIISAHLRPQYERHNDDGGEEGDEVLAAKQEEHACPGKGGKPITW